MAALFWKGATKQGAIASILVGTLTTLLWKEASFVKAIIPNGIYATMDEVLPAIAFSVLSLVFVSIFTREKSSQQKLAS